MVECLALEVSVAHDVQQRAQGRTRDGDAAVIKVELGDALLRGDDRLHALDEDREVLFFRAQHFLGEHGIGMVEDAAEEGVHEALSDPVPEAAGEHGRAVVGEVHALFQIAAGDEKLRAAFLDAHAAPEFGHEQADVVIHAHLRPDAAGGRDEHAVAGEQIRDERVVQIDDRRQGVERAFGQRAFGAGARGRGRFAGHAADELHEQLGQFEVMNRVEHGQRGNAALALGRVVAVAGQHGVDGQRHRLLERDAAAQARGHLREIGVTRREQIGAHLEIAGILRGLAADQPRMRRRDEVAGRAIAGDRADQRLHRLGVLREADGVLDNLAGAHLI